MEKLYEQFFGLDLNITCWGILYGDTGQGLVIHIFGIN